MLGQGETKRGGEGSTHGYMKWRDEGSKVLDGGCLWRVVDRDRATSPLDRVAGHCFHVPLR